MSEQQLSFLSAEPSVFDVNAIDNGSICASMPIEGQASVSLAQRSVDDWVFGLGFTNWKTVIDHALRTGHYELYASDDGCMGLRKYGYRYSPIPRLPKGAITYIQQQLLVIASDRKNAAYTERYERMFSVGSDLAYKCVVKHGACDVTIKQNEAIFRTAITTDQLNFSDASKDDPMHLAIQLEQVLATVGVKGSHAVMCVAKALAQHIIRIALSVR